MKEQTRMYIIALCDAAERMRDAANNLWWAHNPRAIIPGTPPSIDAAQAAHSAAFAALARAEYYVRKEL